MALPLVRLSLFGELVSQLLEELPGESPYFARELSSLSCREGEIVLGGSPQEVGELWRSRQDFPLLYLGGDGSGALRWGETLGEGRVTAVGATQFSKSEGHQLRRSQRFLPSCDLGFDVALKTALWELSGREVAVSLHMNLFSRATLLNLTNGSFRGLQPGTFLSCLDSCPSVSVSRLHVWGGFREPLGPNDPAVALGAEIVRDLLLAWWRKDT